MPELPPLVPPGRELQTEPPKDRKNSEPPKKGAMLETGSPESSVCQQAAPLGTIAEVNEPAKLEPPQAQLVPPTVVAQQAPASNPPLLSGSPAESENTAASNSSPACTAENANEQPGVVQAIYQAIIPSSSAEQTEAAPEPRPTLPPKKPPHPTTPPSPTTPLKPKKQRHPIPPPSKVRFPEDWAAF